MMDILFPCSLCSQAFTLRKLFLKHMKTVHESNVPSICNDDLKSLLICSQCHKQFKSKGLLNKHIHLNHSISVPNLRKYTSKPSEKRVSQKLNAYLSLKVSKHVYLNFTYLSLAYLKGWQQGHLPSYPQNSSPLSIFYHSFKFYFALHMNFQ